MVIYGYSIAPRSWVCVLATINLFLLGMHLSPSIWKSTFKKDYMYMYIIIILVMTLLLGTVDSPFIGVHGIPSMILQQYTRYRMLSGEPLPPWPSLPTNIGATH